MFYVAAKTPWGAQVSGPYSTAVAADKVARQFDRMDLGGKVVHSTERQATVDALVAEGWTVREVAPLAP